MGFRIRTAGRIGKRVVISLPRANSQAHRGICRSCSRKSATGRSRLSPSRSLFPSNRRTPNQHAPLSVSPIAFRRIIRLFIVRPWPRHRAGTRAAGSAFKKTTMHPCSRCSHGGRLVQSGSVAGMAICQGSHTFCISSLGNHAGISLHEPFPRRMSRSSTVPARRICAFGDLAFAQARFVFCLACLDLRDDPAHRVAHGAVRAPASGKLKQRQERE